VLQSVDIASVTRVVPAIIVIDMYVTTIILGTDGSHHIPEPHLLIFVLVELIISVGLENAVLI